jgi:uncharacterized protein YjbJ (UPF0337 family)
MAWDRIEDDWKLPVGNVKENWGKLTQDDNAALNGKRGWFEGKIRELYGDGTVQVRRDVDVWRRNRSLNSARQQ